MASGNPTSTTFSWVDGLSTDTPVLGRHRKMTIQLSSHERERERKKKKKNLNFSLRSTEFLRSKFIGPITKVHILDEGYAWVPKTRDFTEDSSKEFGESKVSGLGSVQGSSWSFFYTPRGRDSSYFGLFSTLRVFLVVFYALKGYLAMFCPNELFCKILGMWE